MANQAAVILDLYAALMSDSTIAALFAAIKPYGSEKICLKYGACSAALTKKAAAVKQYSDAINKAVNTYSMLVPWASKVLGKLQTNAFPGVFLFDDLGNDIDIDAIAIEEIRDGYVQVGYQAALDDTAALLAAALEKLSDFTINLPGMPPPAADNDPNHCNLTRHKRLDAGLPLRYRSTTFTWAANGAPAVIDQIGGLKVENTYSDAGRGFLTESRRQVFGEDYGDFLPAARCGSTENPWSWFLGDKCAARDTLGFSPELLAAFNAAEAGGDESVVTATYSALGKPSTITTDGITTTFIRNTEGAVVETKFPSGLVSHLEQTPEGWLKGLVRENSQGATLSATRLVSNSEGFLLQKCTELVEGACDGYQTLVSEIDFDSEDCADVADYYANVVDPLNDQNTHALKLVIAKRNKENQTVCDGTTSGRITETVYDFLGRAASSLHYDSYDRARSHAHESTIQFDVDGNPTEILYEGDITKKDPDGLRELEKRRYNAFGELVTVYVNRGLISHVDYGLGGEETRVRTFAGTSPFDALAADVTMYPELDTSERVTDQFGQETYSVLNGIEETTTTWGPWGRSLKVTTTGHADQYSISDIAGEVLWSSDGAGTQSVSTYDRSDRIFSSATARESASEERLATNSRVELDLNLKPIASTIFGQDKFGDVVTRMQAVVRQENGWPTASISPDGIATLYTMNLAGWVTKEVRQKDRGSVDFDETAYSHNGAGWVTKVTDPTLLETTYGYFGSGTTSYISYPNNELRSFAYDDFDRLQTEVKPSGTQLKFEYDARGDLVGAQESVAGALSPLLSRKYDVRGRLTGTTMFNDVGGVSLPAYETFSYDALGRLTEETFQVDTKPASSVLSSWALTGGLWGRSVTSSAAAPFAENYDAAGRLASIERGGDLIAFDWLGGMLTTTDWSLGTDQLSEERIHNALGELSSKTFDDGIGGFLDQEVLRDDIGRIVSDKRSFSGKDAFETWKGYQYDGHGWLMKRWNKASSSIDTASLYSAGGGTPTTTTAVTDVLGGILAADNRQWNRNILGSPTSSTHNGTQDRAWSRGIGEELTTITKDGQTKTVDTDTDHRVLSDGTRTFVYSALDQLLEVRDAATDALLEGYAYTASGRLAATIDGATGIIERFAYDGVHVLAAFNDGGTEWEATWGPELDHLVHFESAGEGASVPVQDQQRSVVSTWSRANKELGAFAQYDADGGRSILSGSAGTVACTDSDAVTCDFAGGIPFTYAGAMLSGKTGMLHMRARWLSPGLGQFLTQDPLDYIDSFNRYAYAGFDSINGRDPFGLNTVPGGGDPEPDGNDAPGPDPDAPEPDEWDDGAARFLRDTVLEVAKEAAKAIVKAPLGVFAYTPSPVDTYNTVKALIEEGPAVLLPIKPMLDAGEALGDADSEGEAVEAGLKLVHETVKVVVTTAGAKKLGGGKGGGKRGGKGKLPLRELKQHMKKWSKGNHPTKSESIRYHAKKHGGDDVGTYLRKASNFNKKGASKRTREDGSIKWERKSGEFLIEREGMIVSYGQN